MAAVKAAVLAADIAAAKSEYTAFRHQFLKDFVGGICNPDSILLNRSDTYTTAKTYLECLLRLSIYPTPAIQATTEIGIAACLFPEFRHSAQVLMLALRRYRWIADAFFHADGFHKDRTLRAQVEAIADFTRFLSIYGTTEQVGYAQKTNGTAERAYYLKEALEKQVEACLHLSRPDFSFPPMGPLPAPNFDAVELCTMVNSSFQHEDFPYPDTTSHALPETGCYAMRDSWKSDAQYLFLDAHPQEKTDATDVSRLALYAHGRELTKGSVSVRDSAPLDGDGLKAEWITTPVFDWLEAWRVLVPKFWKTRKPRRFITNAPSSTARVSTSFCTTLFLVRRWGHWNRSSVLIEGHPCTSPRMRDPHGHRCPSGATFSSVRLEQRVSRRALDGEAVIYRCDTESPAGTKHAPVSDAI